MARRSVGGAARRETSRSVGSSPTVSIKETRIAVLRRMLADCDRQLEPWDRRWKRWPGLSLREEWFVYMDAKRRFIREKIKRLSYERKKHA